MHNRVKEIGRITWQCFSSRTAKSLARLYSGVIPRLYSVIDQSKILRVLLLLFRLVQLRWLSHVRNVLAAAWTVAFKAHTQRAPVLVHCSHGWDRTSQVFTNQGNADTVFLASPAFTLSNRETKCGKFVLTL